MIGARGRGTGLGEVRIGSVTLRNPVLLAAGVAGHGTEMSGHARLDRLGGIVVKSLYHEPWPGNPAPRVTGVDGGMLNSVGLQGPGVDQWLAEDLPALLSSGATVIASVWGRTVEEYAKVARALAGASGPVALEVNLSCPNLEGRGSMFAHDAALSAEVISASSVAGLPIWAKLSANTDRIGEVARAVTEAGAEALTVANTLLGLALDPRTGRPRLGAGGGGLSGPAIAPVALRAVWDVRRELPGVPIIGVGGVVSGRSVVEMISAGASAVQVGTATFVSPRAPERILREAERIARGRAVSRWRDLVDSAHAGNPR